MMQEGKITNSEELEFAIFCIENISLRLGMDARCIYDALTKESNILYDYIVPGYEILHTQGKDYIIDDILEVVKERGVKL